MSGPPGTVEYGTRLNCEKEGCLEKLGYLHSDNGRVIIETDWQPRLSNKALADTLERGTMMGHACDIVTRTLPDWEQLDETAIATIVAELRTS